MKPLPKTSKWKDEFGEDAHVEKVNMKSRDSTKDCDHYFEYISGREIQCKECGWGLFIDARDQLEDGKILHQGRLMEF